MELVAEQGPPLDAAGDLAELVAKVSALWTADEWEPWWDHLGDD